MLEFAIEHRDHHDVGKYVDRWFVDGAVVVVTATDRVGGTVGFTGTRCERIARADRTSADAREPSRTDDSVGAHERASSLALHGAVGPPRDA